MKRGTNKLYKIVDLFAGAGGLSLGFKQTNMFNIVAAAENNNNAKLTYKKNHPAVELRDDVCKINYSTIKKDYGSVDVVIGGPPCQGFSNANRQKAQAISTNNSLIKEYVRAVCELQPQVFVMENVSMLRSEVHRFYYSTTDASVIDNFDIQLRKDEIELLPEVFCIDEPGTIIKTLENYLYYLWENKDYSILNLLYRQRNNVTKFKKTINKYIFQIKKISNNILAKELSAINNPYYDFKMASVIDAYNEGNADETQLLSSIEKAIMFQRMYRNYKELIDNKIMIDGFNTSKGICVKVYSFPVLEYVQKILSSKPYCYTIDSGVLNAADFGAPQKRERYIMIGTKSGSKISLPSGKFNESNFRTVQDAIADLETVPPSLKITSSPILIKPSKPKEGGLLSILRDSGILYNHVVTETRSLAKERFRALKPGQNFHCLSDELKSSYTDTKRTQNTIYLRLKYSEPSATVVNVRKSMWVHPVLDRALSIREAARLQTFPDSFIFEGSKDSQYQQVGNAVPPLLARALAEKVLTILEKKKNDG